MAIATNPGVTGVFNPTNPGAIGGVTPAAFTGTTGTFSDAVAVSGALSATGNVTLGNSTGDALVMVTNAMSVTAAGEITHVLQPAFLAVNSATDTDVTGDGTTFAVICNTEVYDQGSDYDGTTGIFTAPVTGRYLFTVTVGLDGLAVGHSNISIILVGSNRSITILRSGLVQTGGAMSTNGSHFLDMDAADTAYVAVTVDGTPKSVDVLATVTTFAGALFV